MVKLHVKARQIRAKIAGVDLWSTWLRVTRTLRTSEVAHTLPHSPWQDMIWASCTICILISVCMLWSRRAVEAVRKRRCWIQIKSMPMRSWDDDDNSDQTEINVHVCDLSPADNEMGYGGLGQLQNEQEKRPSSMLNIATWDSNLREALGTIASTDSFPNRWWKIIRSHFNPLQPLVEGQEWHRRLAAATCRRMLPINKMAEVRKRRSTSTGATMAICVDTL